MKQILLLILSLSLIVGCSQTKVDNRKNEITKVIFATDQCYGHCPVQALEINDSLKFKYHGVMFTDSIGFYTGKIEQAFWDILNTKFERINYKQLDSVYDSSVDDSGIELLIYYNQKDVKKIYARTASLPDSIRDVFSWLVKSTKNLKFQNKVDTLIFPTYLEKTPPMPRIPKTLEFKPPTE